MGIARHRSPWLATIAILGAGLVPQSAGANEQPNLVVVMTDDQTVEELVGNAANAPAARFTRRELRPLVRVVSGLLPLACHVPHRSVRAQPRGDGPLPADRRLRPLRQGKRAAGLAATGGLPHRSPRQVPERLWRPGARGRAAGMERLARDGRLLDVQHVGVHDQQQRPDEDLRPAVRREPTPLPDGRARGQGGFDRQAARRAARSRCSCRSTSWPRITRTGRSSAARARSSARLRVTAGRSPVSA